MLLTVDDSRGLVHVERADSRAAETRLRARRPIAVPARSSRDPAAGRPVGALQVALEPVLREFQPLLDKARPDVRTVVLVPTLSGTDGEPLGGQLDQLVGSGTVVRRCRPGLR
jgi:hypothetical protein